MPTPVIDIEGQERPETLTVKLVGEVYEITPPKAAFALRLTRIDRNDSMALAALMDDWIDTAFGEQTDEVRARLDDLDDALDLWHLITLMQRVIEVVGGVPPTSPPDSAPSQKTTGGRSKGSRSATAGRSTSKR